MRGALSYNENKVNEGLAKGIVAANFGKEFPSLSFIEKLNRFSNLIRWNRKTKTNTVHVSLNFAPGEKLSSDTLSMIAASYMTTIGFGNQPYLVYEHFDAAHPHIHILSTNIRPDGKRIDLHNIGRGPSEKARLAIEKEFSLIRATATSKKQVDTLAFKPVYGKVETRRTIVNAVNAVIKSYRFTSLPQFNAALKQFSVVASRGEESSTMFRKGGLIYSMLSPDGKMIGVPVKASSIHFKPTLKAIEKQFRLNELQREGKRSLVASKIDSVLQSGNRLSLYEFDRQLAAKAIYLVLRLSKDSRVFGMTFVDNQHKVVFNGSDLGKQFGARQILEKLSEEKHESLTNTSATTNSQNTSSHHAFDTPSLHLIQELMEPEQYLSTPLLPKKRKKKKRKSQR